MTLRNFRFPNLSGIPTDWIPVTPADATDNTGDSCIGLYIENGGVLSVQFGKGPTREITVPDTFVMPGLVTRVRASITGSGTVASNIYALIG